MKEESRPRHGVLTALIWWTGTGTVLALVGIWAHIPTGVGLLWPAAIHPHWLGAIIGAAAFVVLTTALQARAQKATTGRPAPDVELDAARARVAKILRAHLTQQAAQRPE